MERTIVKYKKYPTQGSGHINVPKAIAGALKWKPEDDIVMEFDVKDGNQGIFLHKLTTKNNNKE